MSSTAGSFNAMLESSDSKIIYKKKERKSEKQTPKRIKTRSKPDYSVCG